MRYLLCAVLALVPLLARAQQASEEEIQALAPVAQCLAAGLPRDWAQAEMTIDLEAPNADHGDVRYVFRRALSGGEYQLFKPCDYQAPAKALLDLRKIQAPERGRWKSARFVIYPDGKFDLTFDYVKK
jgi:hypothetical protein